MSAKIRPIAGPWVREVMGLDHPSWFEVHKWMVWFYWKVRSAWSRRRYRHYCPDVIVSANLHHYSDEERIRIAEQVAQGTKFVIVQHGGNYGISKRMPVEDWERSVADEFWTWGWED